MSSFVWLRSSAFVVRSFSRLSGGDRQIITRAGVLAVLVPLYYAFDWTLLRLAIRGAVVPPLILLGHRVNTLNIGEDLLLVFGSHRGYEIGPSCTYVDLVLVLAPFMWRFRRPLSANLTRLAALMAAVFAVNAARVILALHLFERGGSWLAAHRIPDLVVHFVAITCTVVLAVKVDLNEDSKKSGQGMNRIGARLEEVGKLT